MNLRYYSIVFIMTVVAPLTAATPNGWKMTDRFSGFRYEITGKVYNVGIRHAIQKAANDLACFGWVQYSEQPTVSVVGEVRCNKNMAEVMKKWMVSSDEHPEGSFIEHVNIKDYQDSKIKLHFSHFKILDSERTTCFRDTPHQCPEFNS